MSKSKEPLFRHDAKYLSNCILTFHCCLQVMLSLIIIPIPRVFSTGKYERRKKSSLQLSFNKMSFIEIQKQELVKIRNCCHPYSPLSGHTKDPQVQACPGSKGLNSSEGETASGKATFLQLILFADTDSGILRG